jgi:hypothetical protein
MTINLIFHLIISKSSYCLHYLEIVPDI